MGYHELSDDEVLAFIAEEPARPGVLATTRKDGRPHAAPIWYDVEDGVVFFNTGADTVKGRTLARSGYASLVVQDDRPPFSFATVSGPVELVDDLDQVQAWAARIGGRYMGVERADEFGRRNGVPGELLVRLTPERLTGARDLAD